MLCPFCHAHDTKVIDSRLAGAGDQVRRRRECIECSERFTSYEKVELSLPRITKQDGSCEPFEDEKLVQGMLRALQKRPVTSDQIDAAVDRIKRRMTATGEREIDSRRLGEWVMTELKNLDEIGYIRFASVYRCFQDVSDFEQEVKKLQQQVEPVEL